MKQVSWALLYGSIALLASACGSSQRSHHGSQGHWDTRSESTAERSPVSPESPSGQAAGIELEGARSTSLRNPNDGTLRNGVLLPLDAYGLRSKHARGDAARYGTVEVVRALLAAARRVQDELGGVGVTIHDLSYEGGGPIPRHGSHQSGRDVDVLFYQLGPDGEPIQSVGAFFDPRGEGVDFRTLADPSDDVQLRIDLPRTWLFVQTLIEDRNAALQRIFVAEHIRALLLDHARATGAPASTIARFEEMTCQPQYPHDDHFHFRFFCSAEDIEAGCRDSEPIYPWRRKELVEQGVEPLPLLPKRPGTTSDIVTHDEARKAAGPMHSEPERWLDRRKAWLRKPSPGRPYCP